MQPYDIIGDIHGHADALDTIIKTEQVILGNYYEFSNQLN